MVVEPFASRRSEAIGRGCSAPEIRRVRHSATMHLTFLGGASTVTGSRFLLDTGRARVLVDCGMFQGSPNEVIRNRVPLGFEPAELDAILITHAHLDHCGYLPVVVREGFSGPIYLTSASAELVEIVLLDSGRLQEEFAKRHNRWERRHPDEAVAADAKTAAEYRRAAAEASRAEARRADAEGHVPTSVEAVAGESEALGAETESDDPLTDRFGHPLPNPDDAEQALREQPPVVAMDLDAALYDEEDAKRVPPLFQRARYGRPMDVAPGVRATFFDAGHILGSAIISIEVQGQDGGPASTIVFSGDLGRPGTPIISDPTAMTVADYVVVESTYGGREHEPQDEAIRLLREVVHEVDRAGGVLLIPAFAIGRTQEIVWELDRLISAGEIPTLPLYLDSPMASRASDVYRRHPEFYDEETAKLLREGETPLDYPDQRITRDVEDSKAIRDAARPYMIVSSNGMLTGGRSVAHLRNLIDDPDATILFVGYQGEGTLGRHLQDGATKVKVDGQIRDVRCRVRSISGFSAHADESELLDWLRGFGEGRKPGDAGFPKTVFLVHGDPEAQIAISPKVEALGFRAHTPAWRESVTLD
jgi:metallo-beta-lactamase family protein